jgi:type IV pilus assembly protein PilE
MRRAAGFTLIELLITVTIVAILVTVALPSYQTYMIRAVRSQGQQFLTDLAQREEQYFLDVRSYATGIGVAAGQINLSIPNQVAAKYQPPVFVVNNAAAPPTFMIVLVPTPGGTVTNDGQLIINNLGQTWREVSGGDRAFGTSDCRWTDYRCTPS